MERLISMTNAVSILVSDPATPEELVKTLLRAEESQDLSAQDLIMEQLTGLSVIPILSLLTWLIGMVALIWAETTNQLIIQPRQMQLLNNL